MSNSDQKTVAQLLNEFKESEELDKKAASPELENESEEENDSDSKESEDDEDIDEATMVTFAKANPRFGEFVYTVGGPGVGKSYAIAHVIDGDFTKINSDDITELFADVKYFFGNTIVGKFQRDEFEKPEDISLSDPDITAKIRTKTRPIAFKLLKRIQDAMKAHDPSKLPNILIDTTGQDTKKMVDCLLNAKHLGYRTTLVYVTVKDPEVARQRNIERGKEPGGRTVPDDVFKAIHAAVEPSFEAGKNYADRAWIVYSEKDLVWQRVCQGKVEGQTCGSLGYAIQQLPNGKFQCRVCGSNDIKEMKPNPERIVRIK
jgi:predicted ABC-type ATPase